MNNVKVRLYAVDWLRGLALLGMVGFHVFVILEFLKLADVDTHALGFAIWAKVVQVLFVGIVGVAMVLSYQRRKEGFVCRQVLRAALIFLMAEIVSAATYLMVGHLYVKFGILHFIALGVLILAPLISRKLLLLVLAFVAVFLGPIFAQISTDISILYIFGFRINGGEALDYFPIFPWISVMAVGALFTWYGRGVFEWMSRQRFPLLEWMGRHTLAIYMLHVPIILVILFFLGYDLL